MEEVILRWWEDMNLEQQFYAIIKFNHLINGDRTRHPHTLTDLEIEIIYKAFIK